MKNRYGYTDQKMDAFLSDVNVKNKNHTIGVVLTVSFDMGWQRKSMDHIYNSRSGHPFLIGMETKKVVSMVIYCKDCKKCNLYARQIKEGKAATTSHPPSHRCPKNYADKSSKSMKADAAVEMCVKLVRQYKFNVYVDTFVSDDNATTRKI